MAFVTLRNSHPWIVYKPRSRLTRRPYWPILDSPPTDNGIQDLRLVHGLNLPNFNGADMAVGSTIDLVPVVPLSMLDRSRLVL